MRIGRTVVVEQEPTARGLAFVAHRRTIEQALACLRDVKGSVPPSTLPIKSPLQVARRTSHSMTLPEKFALLLVYVAL